MIKRCPLLSISRPTASTFMNCIDQECAWWNNIQKCCAIVNISIAINNLWCDARLNEQIMREVKDEH